MDKKFACEIFNKTFAQKVNLVKHRKIHNSSQAPKFSSQKCNEIFTRKDNLMRHEKVHDNPIYACTVCPMIFHRKENLNQHTRPQHANLCEPSRKRKKSFPNPPAKKSRKNKQALNVFSSKFFYPEENEVKDLRSFEEHISLSIADALKQKIIEFNSIKWHLLAKVIFERESDTF